MMTAFVVRRATSASRSISAKSRASRARYAEITRMVDPTYQKAVDSGLGIPEVWNGDAWTPALAALHLRAR